jgi:putative acetyltransferase
MNIAISELTIDQYDEVVDLWRRCEGVGLSSADSRDRIEVYLDRNPGMSFVAGNEGQVVGAVLCGHDGRRGYIHHLAVDPRFRRKGIGKTLADHCLRGLRSAGIQKCHLFVFNDNETAIRFWEAEGWTVRTDISVISKVIEQGDAMAD